MRNLQFYKDKLAEVTSLTDLERATNAAKKQVQHDINTIQNRRQKLMDKVKELDKQIADIQTIDEQINQSVIEKTSHIARNMTGQKKRGRKPKSKG